MADTTAAREAGGWATVSLIGSLRDVAMVAVLGWQLVMVWATFSTLGTDGYALALGHLVPAVLAGLALTRPIPVVLVPLTMFGVGLWSLLASNDIDSVLAFATCWEYNFGSCVAGLVILRRYVVGLVIGGSAITAGSLLAAGWDQQFSFSIVVTQTSIIVALRWGLPLLLGVARATEAATEAALEATRRAEVARQVSRQVAEEARILHDTAINTLGAIANGGAGVRSTTQVRDQCLRDVGFLRTLSSADRAAAPADILELFTQPGLPAVRTGLTDAELARVAERLPQQVLAGLLGCVREAVTNATKHSGADTVAITTSLGEESLVVEIVDAGVGMPPGAEGMGLQRSIRDRARDLGFAARVSTAPGAGTSVALVVPLFATGFPRPASEAAAEAVAATVTPDPVEALRLRAGQLWALGVAAVSVVLMVGGGANHYYALPPMIAVMLAVVWLARLRWWDRRPGGLYALLVGATCLIFFGAAAATDFGAADAVHWQALAPTGAFVLLLSQRPDRVRLRWAFAVWIVGIVAVAALSQRSPVAAQITLVAGAAGVGFALVWGRFQVLIGRLAKQALQAERRADAALLSVELNAAAQNNFRHWIQAGLDDAVELLRSVADGERLPTEATTRAACADEERYLRQLVQINPESMHLSRALMPALRMAREREIVLDLRLSPGDAPDPEVARDVASGVAHGLRCLSAGDRLAASLFPVAEGLQLTLVGEGLTLPAGPTASRMENLGAIDIVELTYVVESERVRDRREEGVLA